VCCVCPAQTVHYFSSHHSFSLRIWKQRWWNITTHYQLGDIISFHNCLHTCSHVFVIGSGRTSCVQKDIRVAMQPPIVHVQRRNQSIYRSMEVLSDVLTHWGAKVTQLTQLPCWSRAKTLELHVSVNSDAYRTANWGGLPREQVDHSRNLFPEYRQNEMELIKDKWENPLMRSQPEWKLARTEHMKWANEGLQETVTRRPVCFMPTWHLDSSFHWWWNGIWEIQRTCIN